MFHSRLKMLPQTRDEALLRCRRLAVWDEYRPQYSAQAIAVARLISRRAIKRHGNAREPEQPMKKKECRRQKNIPRQFPLQDALTIFTWNGLSRRTAE